MTQGGPITLGFRLADATNILLEAYALPDAAVIRWREPSHAKPV
jgi:hypothetical protein